MSGDLFSASILLILVLDPFGNLPLVASALSRVPPQRRVCIILRECLFAYAILLAFLFGGRTFPGASRAARRRERRGPKAASKRESAPRGDTQSSRPRKRVQGAETKRLRTRDLRTISL